MSSRNKGILCILSSAFFFALMSVFVRLSGDVPSMQKVFFRNLVAIVIAVVMLAKDHQPVSLSGPAKVSLFYDRTAGQKRGDLFADGGGFGDFEHDEDGLVVPRDKK